MQLFHRLGFQIGLGVTGMLVLLTAVLFVPLFNQSRTALIGSYEEKQVMSLNVLVDKLVNERGLNVQRNANGEITGATAAAIEAFSNHDLIDSVGAISGETATVFVWDDAENDYVRRSTNIIKPNGERAVGTPLGQSNPVYAAMRRGEVFRGEATILGKEYLTIYVPVETPAGDPLGILYVGVAQEKMAASIAEMLWTGLAIAAAALSVFTAITVFAVRFLLAPIGRLGAAVDAVRNKHYDTAVPYVDRPDGVGIVARSVDEFRHQLRDADEIRATEQHTEQLRSTLFDALCTSMDALKNGAVNTRIESGAWAELGAKANEICANFNELSETFGALTSEVRRSLTSVQESAADLKSMSGDISRRAENQAATLEESAAALEEMSSSVKAAAERAQAANDMAEENRRRAESGTDVMQRALSSMANISKSSNDITNIISVIDDISFQTNLLALNAGVEAARAGESGKGFAVVASEVRSLAQRASESAQEIRDLVLASAALVEEGEQLMQETHSTFTEIVERSGQVTGLVSEIAVSAREQAIGVQEINAGVSQLDSVTQENAAMVVELNTTSDRLNAKAEKAAAVVAAFLNADEPTARPMDIADVPLNSGNQKAAPKSDDRKGDAWTQSEIAHSEAPLKMTGTDGGDWSEF
jgi:methyl-accepting chemotaxis protein